MSNNKSNVRDCQSMPHLVKDADFNIKLKMPERNLVHTQAFLEKGVINYTLLGYKVPNGYRLVKSNRKEQYRLITTGDEPETVYLLELLFRHDIVYDRITCTQIKVWRTVALEHNEAVKDLPRAFFAHLLLNYHIVVSDEEHTFAGKRFWETMIDWALKTGYFVYVSDGTQIERPLIAMANINDFYQQWEAFCWGEDADVYRHRLVVISKDPITS